MGSFLRTVASVVAVGALLGITVVSLWYPAFLGWNNTPAFGSGMCICSDTARQAAQALLHAQLVGAGVGGGVGLVGGIWFANVLRKRAKAKALAESNASAAVAAKT